MQFSVSASFILALELQFYSKAPLRQNICPVLPPGDCFVVLHGLE